MAKGIVHNVMTGAQEVVDVSPPTPEEMQAIAAQKIVESRRMSAKPEAALAGILKTVTPQQAVDYIEQNVNDLASAKVALKIMARMIVSLRDYVMPELPDESL